MELSVIIVNYNVRYFLEQCLVSALNALGGIDGEVWVVDNASTDGSVEMIKFKFPHVKLIANEKNVGFSKANNQAIKLASGKYILLLNPDTVVQEDTFRQCICFMEKHPEAGGMTVKMIDGKGHYLPESKRGFPSPWASFCKIFGLTALFPRSKRFAGYYLGHLDRNSTHAIEIMPGAFMFLRAEALVKTGLLDEQFFMYGEDIDLSYRILQNGYLNYYYPNCQIIHYKGESTKKGSLNYVVMFYKAMILFAQKHFSKQKQQYFVALIKLAVFLRASTSALKRILISVWLPLTDLALMLLGAYLIVPWWEKLRFDTTNVYPRNVTDWLISFYIAIWLIFLWFHGAYDKPQNKTAGLKGILYGALTILAVYSVFPQSLRFSRAIIILLTVWSTFAVLLNRIVSSKFINGLLDPNTGKKSVCFIGTKTEFDRSKPLLLRAGISDKNITHLLPNEILDEQLMVKDTIIADTINVKHVGEIIFGTKGIPIASIIHAMMNLSQYDIDFKIALHDGESIVGSNSIDTQGEFYLLEPLTIVRPNVKRQKRVFDILSAILILTFFPILLLTISKPIQVLKNAIRVLLGAKTWIGYYFPSPTKPNRAIKPSVYKFGERQNQSATNFDVKFYYPHSFSIKTEVSELLRNIFKKKG